MVTRDRLRVRLLSRLVPLVLLAAGCAAAAPRGLSLEQRTTLAERLAAATAAVTPVRGVFSSAELEALERDLAAVRRITEQGCRAAGAAEDAMDGAERLTRPHFPAAPDLHVAIRSLWQIVRAISERCEGQPEAS